MVSLISLLTAPRLGSRNPGIQSILKRFNEQGFQAIRRAERFLLETISLTMCSHQWSWHAGYLFRSFKRSTVFDAGACGNTFNQELG